MIARYAGTCATCGQPVNVGEQITWSRKHRGRVLHISCPAKSSTTSETTNETETAEMPACPINPLHKRIQVSLEVYRNKGSHYCSDCTEWFTPAVNTFPDYNNEVFLPTDNSTGNLRVYFKLSQNSDKINAIKAIRAVTGFDLLTAKHASEGTVFHIKSSERDQLTALLSEYGKVIFSLPENTQATITTKPVKLPASNGHASEPVILDDLSAVIAQAIARHLPVQETTAQIDESAVRAIVAAEMQSLMTPTIVTVARAETGETRDMGVQHKQFPLLLQVIASGCNVWMSGPAGSGKTTAADNASQALDKKFYFCGAQSNEYGLLGFRTATGELVRTPFREAYEHGGVFLFDEIDASAPTALLAFNAALANGWCAFPDGMIRKHTDFIVIAAANTFGLGGTNDYVGRMKQDAAFIDRFVFMAWDVDESLESSTCGNTAWAKRVQKIRAKIKAKGIKCIVSPRASYYGAKLLAQGIDQDMVETLVLRKGLDATTWESVN